MTTGEYSANQFLLAFTGAAFTMILPIGLPVAIAEAEIRYSVGLEGVAFRESSTPRFAQIDNKET